MTPLPHQIEKSDEAYGILKSKGLVYIAGAVRSGKSLTMILTCEKTKAENILVLTKKAAIDGIKKFKANMTKSYTITNYEQVSKLNKDNYDLVVIDEAHNLAPVGKPSKRVKDIRALAYDKPVILMSGTPHSESKAGLYHQCCITKYSPFNRYTNFYRFFDVFGILTTKWIMGIQRKDYKKIKEVEFDVYMQDYWVRMTQLDAGIKQEQKDILHYIELDDETKKIYNTLLKDSVVELIDEQGNEITLVGDSVMKLRTMLHQLEEGVIKI